MTKYQRAPFFLNTVYIRVFLMKDKFEKLLVIFILIFEKSYFFSKILAYRQTTIVNAK
jgi:hypothetical protein